MPVAAAADVVADQDVQVPEFGTRDRDQLLRCVGVGQVEATVGEGGLWVGHGLSDAVHDGLQPCGVGPQGWARSWGT
ncbi:hypothetical protein ACFYTC_46650 [Actinomadura nitritigenes]|uniref:hypothetical protein n=1 Tax=Actinomadura nitritigenes TaxID=134602 RepID=UPI0036A60347